MKLKIFLIGTCFIVTSLYPMQNREHPSQWLLNLMIEAVRNNDNFARGLKAISGLEEHDDQKDNQMRHSERLAAKKKVCYKE
jgi:hypothetical protein